MKTNEVIGRYFRDVEPRLESGLKEDYERILATSNFSLLKHFLEEHNLIHFMRDAKGNTVLHLMAGHQMPKRLEPLINEGLDVGAVNEFGQTPLHSACTTRCLSNVQLLVNSGADLQAIDNYGNSVLHVAAYCGRTYIVDYLVNKGVDLKLRNVAGATAVDLAIENEHYEIAESYIKHSA